MLLKVDVDVETLKQDVHNITCVPHTGWQINWNKYNAIVN